MINDDTKNDASFPQIFIERAIKVILKECKNPTRYTLSLLNIKNNVLRYELKIFNDNDKDYIELNSDYLVANITNQIKKDISLLDNNNLNLYNISGGIRI